MQQLFLYAHQWHCREVLFWSLGRLSCVTETFKHLHLQRLTPAGVQFKYFTEQYLDKTGLFPEAIIGFLAAIAKQERMRFSERIKAGQARSSKAPGRPALNEEVIAELRRLRAAGLSFKKIQVATGVPVATMHKYLAAV